MDIEKLKIMADIMRAHNETIDRLQECIDTNNSNMFCGIYGNIGGGIDLVFEALQEFNVFIEYDDIDNFFYDLYDEYDKIQYGSFGAFKKAILSDAVPGRYGYILFVGC